MALGRHHGARHPLAQLHSGRPDLVGLIESEHGEAILRQVLPAVEELIVPLEYAEALLEF
jgi:hypothetical protein